MIAEVRVTTLGELVDQVTPAEPDSATGWRLFPDLDSVAARYGGITPQ